MTQLQQAVQAIRDSITELGRITAAQSAHVGTLADAGLPLDKATSRRLAEVIYGPFHELEDAYREYERLLLEAQMADVQASSAA